MDKEQSLSAPREVNTYLRNTCETTYEDYHNKQSFKLNTLILKNL